MEEAGAETQRAIMLWKLKLEKITDGDARMMSSEVEQVM